MSSNKNLCTILNLMLITLIFSCKKNIEEKMKNIGNLQKNNLISVENTKFKNFNLLLTANGQLRSSQQAHLFFKAQGQITKLNINNTNYINANELLATLDNRTAILALDQAQDQNKKAAFTLNKLLIDYGGNDLDTTSVQPRILESIKVQSGYYEAQTALKNAKMQYENTILRAPFSGVVANLKTKVYNQASLIDPFCTLINPNSLEVEAFILESELLIVSVGQVAKITTLTNANKFYTGKVSEINPQVNQTGLVAIKIKILNPDKSLLDGMNCRIQIEKTIPNQLIVPKSAIVDRSGRKVVFTYEKGLAKWHYVTIAYENDSEVVIKEGLKVGDQIIVDGNLNLGHDAPVSLKR